VDMGGCTKAFNAIYPPNKERTMFKIFEFFPDKSIICLLCQLAPWVLIPAACWELWGEEVFVLSVGLLCLWYEKHLA